jgi:hypothetical protein
VWCRGARLVTSAAGREEHITSTDNATVKHFAKLVRNRGYREECGSIVVAGSGILSEVCGGVAGDAVGSALTLFLAEDADVPPGVTARRIVRAPEHVLKKAAGLQSVDRVDAVAELSMPPVVGVGALTEAGANHEAPRAGRDPGPGEPRHAGAHGTGAGMGRGRAAAGDVRSVQRQGERLRARVIRKHDTIGRVHSIFKPGTARSVTLSGWTPRRPIALPVLYIYFTCETKPSF